MHWVMTVNRWWLAHRTVQQLYAALRQLQTLLYGAAGLATVNLTIFAKHGFLNQIFSLSTTIPFLKLLAPFIAQLSFLLNLAVLLGFTGLFTARLVRPQFRVPACSSAIMALVLLRFTEPVMLDIDVLQLPRFLNLEGQVLPSFGGAIILGLITSWLFNRWGRYATALLLGEVGLVFGGTILWVLLVPDWSRGDLYGTLWPILGRHAPLWIVVCVMVNCFLNLIGMTGTIGAGNYNGGSVAVHQNLSYALTTHHLTRVPWPINLHAIATTYANTGGPGMLLAAVLAVWLLTRHQAQSPARASWWPALFNVGAPLTLTLPIMLNPIMVVPFVTSSVVACLIPIGLTTVRWLPPSVYPVPTTTPGFLRGFLATNGNLVALFVGCLTVVVAVAIYWPFVKLAVQQLEDKNEHDETMG